MASPWVEFRVDMNTDRFWLLEINGRFWGSLPLAIFAGVDFPRMLVELLLYDRVPEVPPPRQQVFARRFSRDLSWIKMILRQDPNDPHLQTKPLLASLLEWPRALTGKETLGRCSAP